MAVHTRALAAFAVALLGAAGLTGCGNANAASGAGAEFEAHMLGRPGVIDVYAGGTNNLPFVGNVSGSVELSDDVTDDQIEAVVDRAGEYFAEHDSDRVNWSGIDVSVGFFSLRVEKTKTVNDDLRVLLREVRADPLYVGADVGTAWCDFALATAPSAEALVVGLDASVGLLATNPPAGGDVTVGFASEPGGFPEYQLTQRDGAGRPDAAIAALEALWAIAPPVTALADNDSFAVTLADEAAVPAALAVVTGILAGSAVTEVTVEGP